MGSVLVIDEDVVRGADEVRLFGRLGAHVALVTTAAAAVARVREGGVDVAVVHVLHHGPELCRELVESAPGTIVVMISSGLVSAPDRIAGLLAGAEDCMTDPVDPDELLARVRRSMARAVIAPSHAASDAPLTPREHEVLDQLVAGSSHRQIATELNISPKTVDAHVQHILAKLGVHSGGEAVAVAVGRRSAAR